MFTPVLKLEAGAVEQDKLLQGSRETHARALSERLERLHRLISESEAHITAQEQQLLRWSPFVADTSSKDLRDMRRAVIILLEYKEYLMDRLRDAGGGRLLEASPEGGGGGEAHPPTVDQARKVEIDGAGADQLKLREPAS